MGCVYALKLYYLALQKNKIKRDYEMNLEKSLDILENDYCLTANENLLLEIDSIKTELERINDEK